TAPECPSDHSSPNVFSTEFMSPITSLVAASWCDFNRRSSAASTQPSAKLKTHATTYAGRIHGGAPWVSPIGIKEKKAVMATPKKIEYAIDSPGIGCAACSILCLILCQSDFLIAISLAVSPDGIAMVWCEEKLSSRSLPFSGVIA